MARMKKADLVAKIAKEQNLDPVKLERLSVSELEKMDVVVPDNGKDFEGAFNSTIEDSNDPNPEDLIIKVPEKVKFRTNNPKDELERKTPGKYRKFIQKGSTR